MVSSPLPKTPTIAIALSNQKKHMFCRLHLPLRVYSVGLRTEEDKNFKFQL